MSFRLSPSLARVLCHGARNSRERTLSQNFVLYKHDWACGLPCKIANFEPAILRRHPVVSKCSTNRCHLW